MHCLSFPQRLYATLGGGRRVERSPETNVKYMGYLCVISHFNWRSRRIYDSPRTIGWQRYLNLMHVLEHSLKPNIPRALVFVEMAKGLLRVERANAILVCLIENIIRVRRSCGMRCMRAEGRIARFVPLNYCYMYRHKIVALREIVLHSIGDMTWLTCQCRTRYAGARTVDSLEGTVLM